MGVSLKNLKKVLVFIEDRDFYKHSGLSYKAIGRGVLSIFKLKRRSGGINDTSTAYSNTIYFRP